MRSLPVRRLALTAGVLSLLTVACAAGQVAAQSQKGSAEPTPAPRADEQHEPVQKMLAQQQRLLDLVSGRDAKAKDFWDKFSAVSAFLSSVVLAAVALFVTVFMQLRSSGREAALKEHQNQLYEADIVSKFLPYLLDQKKAEKALLYINRLASIELVKKLVTADPGPAGQKALAQIARTAATPAERKVAAQALKKLDVLVGHTRMTARTSVSAAPTETFKSLDELLAALPSDEKMRQHDPPISRAPSSGRVAEEERNVTVDTFLHAAKRNMSNDFNLILGGGTAQARRPCLSAKISALPKKGRFNNVLKPVRKEFEQLFQNKPVPGSRWTFYDPPIPVQVSGSLFYNILHLPGTVGPRDMATDSSWEIRPITRITEK
jgi:hypothetical protein